MSLGFIIIRHVNNKVTDLYWKECYNCIRKFYDNPIMIIDDSSNKKFLNENIFLTNCTVIYDTEHKGAAELLPYYYFHKLKPFDTAVIIHDSIFIQDKINFELDPTENIRFLWTFSYLYNFCESFEYTRELAQELIEGINLIDFYHNHHLWNGSFGVMSAIRWSFLDELDKKHYLFSRLLNKMKTRDNRHGLERLLGVLSYYNNKNIKPAFFGDIHQYYSKYDTSFFDYLTKDFSQYPIMKVWTGR